MAVDILSITPPDEKTRTFPFGGSEVTIRGLKMSQIARLAQRFDGFRKVYFTPKEEEAAAGIDANVRAAAMIEAYPAIIVAGTRKDGAKDAHLVEAHIERFPHEEIAELARAVLRLTNGEPDPEDEKKDAPLSDSGGAAEASTISSPPSNT
jgi:hypothetical protein